MNKQELFENIKKKKLDEQIDAELEFQKGEIK